MNEPHPGYIGSKDISSFNQMKDLHLSAAPTALQSWALGMGLAQEVDFYVKSWPWPTKRSGTKILNTEKESAWLPGVECIWKQHGVWEITSAGQPVLIQSNYFSKKMDGTPIDFYKDFYTPFIRGFAEAITSASPNFMVFFEPIPNEEPPVIVTETEDWHKQLVYAPHWYDLGAVFSKSFDGYLTHDVQGLSKVRLFNSRGLKTYLPPVTLG